MLKYLELDECRVIQAGRLRHNVNYKCLYGNDIGLFIFLGQVEKISLI
jgi:hypothetical protein